MVMEVYSVTRMETAYQVRLACLILVYVILTGGRESYRDDGSRSEGDRNKLGESSRYGKFADLFSCHPSLLGSGKSILARLRQKEPSLRRKKSCPRSGHPRTR